MYAATSKKNRQAPRLWACRNSFAGGISPPLHNCEHNITCQILSTRNRVDLVCDRRPGTGW
jgi:hypothetical protein